MSDSFFWIRKERLNAFLPSRAGVTAEYLFLTLCGSAYALIFPAANWSFLAWFGMLPVLFSLRGASSAGALIRGFVWGYFWSLCSFFWLREIFFPIPFVMAAVLGAFPAIWAYGHAFLERNLALPAAERLKGCEEREKCTPFPGSWRGLLFLFSSASLWVVTEHLRSWIFTGLPWNLLALSQWKNTVLIQICEYTGMYGVSFAVCLVNLGLFLLLIRFPYSSRERKYTRNIPAMLALATACSAFPLGFFLMKRNAGADGKYVSFPVGVTQTNLSQRRFGSKNLTREAIQRMTGLSEELLRKSPGIKVIVWPETAVACSYVLAGDMSDEYRLELGRLLAQGKTAFLIGSIDYEFPKENLKQYKVYNSALYLTRPGGFVEDRYSKVHRVPFGEYVPFGNEFPVLNSLVGMGRNLTPGKSLRPIALGDNVRAGVSICFESVFENISRGHAANGANMLLVITNDAWYPTSNEPEQHFAHSVFRAVENRLPLVRCGNGSASALISAKGEILDTVLYEKDSAGNSVFNLKKKGFGAKLMEVRVPENPRPSFYTQYGNLFVLFCGFFAFCGFLTAFVEWRMYRVTQADEHFFHDENI